MNHFCIVCARSIRRPGEPAIPGVLKSGNSGLCQTCHRWLTRGPAQRKEKKTPYEKLNLCGWCGRKMRAGHRKASDYERATIAYGSHGYCNVCYDVVKAGGESALEGQLDRAVESYWRNRIANW